VSERERIMRIIDPRLANEGWVANFGGDPEVMDFVRDIAGAKADAILARPEPSETVVGLYYALKLCVARIERPNLSPDANVVLERARAAIAAYEGERK
jgi:hypothetical protein